MDHTGCEGACNCAEEETLVNIQSLPDWLKEKVSRIAPFLFGKNAKYNLQFWHEVVGLPNCGCMPEDVPAKIVPLVEIYELFQSSAQCKRFSISDAKDALQASKFVIWHEKVYGCPPYNNEFCQCFLLAYIAHFKGRCEVNWARAAFEHHDRLQTVRNTNKLPTPALTEQLMALGNLLVDMALHPVSFTREHMYKTYSVGHALSSSPPWDGQLAFLQGAQIDDVAPHEENRLKILSHNHLIEDENNILQEIIDEQKITEPEVEVLLALKSVQETEEIIISDSSLFAIKEEKDLENPPSLFSLSKMENQVGFLRNIGNEEEFPFSLLKAEEGILTYEHPYKNFILPEEAITVMRYEQLDCSRLHPQKEDLLIQELNSPTKLMHLPPEILNAIQIQENSENMDEVHKKERNATIQNQNYHHLVKPGPKIGISIKIKKPDQTSILKQKANFEDYGWSSESNLEQMPQNALNVTLGTDQAKKHTLECLEHGTKKYLHSAELEIIKANQKVLVSHICQDWKTTHQSFDNVSANMVQSAVKLENSRSSHQDILGFRSSHDYKTYQKKLDYVPTKDVQLVQPEEFKAFNQEIQEPHVCWDCKTKQACLDYAPPKDVCCAYEQTNLVMNLKSMALNSKSVKNKEQFLDHPPPLCSLGVIQNQDGSLHDMVNDEQFPFGLLKVMEATAPCDTTYQTNQESSGYIRNKVIVTVGNEKSRDKSIPISGLDCMCCNCKAKQESFETPNEANVDHELPSFESNSNSMCWDCKSQQRNAIHFPKKVVEFAQNKDFQECLHFDGNSTNWDLKTKQEISRQSLKTKVEFPQDTKRVPFLDKDGICQECNKKKFGLAQGFKEDICFLQENSDHQEVDHYSMCGDKLRTQRDYDHVLGMEMEHDQLDSEVDQQEAPFLDPNGMCMDCKTKGENLSLFLKEMHLSQENPEVSHYEAPHLDNLSWDSTTKHKRLIHRSQKEVESLHMETTKIFHISIPPLHQLESRTRSWDPKVLQANELLESMNEQTDSSKVENSIHPSCLSREAGLFMTSLIEPPQRHSKHYIGQSTDAPLGVPTINEAMNEILDKIEFEETTNNSASLYELATLEISSNKDVHKEHAKILTIQQNGVDTYEDEKLGTLHLLSPITSLEVDHDPSTRCMNAKSILEKTKQDLAQETTHVEEITCQGDALHALNEQLTTIFRLKLEAYEALRVEVKALTAKMQDNDESFLEQQKREKEEQTRLLQIELGDMQKMHNTVQKKLDLSNCLLVEVLIGVDNLQLEKEKAEKELDKLKEEGLCKTQVNFAHLLKLFYLLVQTFWIF